MAAHSASRHSWPEVHAAEKRARALIAKGELDRAEEVLNGGIHQRREDGSGTARLVALLAEVRLWQGRFEEAGQLLKEIDGGRDGVRVAVLRGFLAWACADSTALSQCIHRLEATPRQKESVWASALRLLRHGLDPVSGTVGRREFAFSLRRQPSLVVRNLGLAILQQDGRHTRAPTGRRRRNQDRSRLHQLLLDWTEGRRDTRSLIDEIARTGARGILRWRRGPSTMYLVHVLPALVEALYGADDELSALRLGCGWGRRSGGAEWVGFLAGTPPRIIVDEGRVSEPTETISGGRPVLGTQSTVVIGDAVLVSEPVRYAGTVVGEVMIRGVASRVQSMREVATTLAVLCGPALRQRLDVAESRIRAQAGVGEILGRSPALTGLRETIARVAPTPFSVLIEGESGSGKELVARALHRLSPRRDRRFCAVNCAALTDDLLEAELFGHSRGAFTGAVGSRVGLLEDARGGTLFLDEAAELSPRAQAKLLRVLQEREVRRVGENTSRAIDIRVIAATNVSLPEAAAAGRFRDDLLFRLAVVRVRLPPLRDRVEDIPLLAGAFWKTALADVGKHSTLGSDAIVALCRYHWPGNIRELQNVVSALAVVAPARGRVGARHVQHVLAEVSGPYQAQTGVALSLEQARRSCEQQTIAAALVRHGGRKNAAARDLGVSRQGLLKAMRRVGLLAEERATGVA